VGDLIVNTVEFTFPGNDPGTTSRLAQQLRRALVIDGLDADRIVIRRQSNETMDAGSLVEIIKMGIEYAALIVEIGAMAHTIYEFCKKERCALKIRTPRGEIEVGPGEIDIEQLRKILADAPSVDARPE